MHKYRITSMYSNDFQREVFVIEKKHFFGWRLYEDYQWFSYFLASERLDQIING